MTKYFLVMLLASFEASSPQELPRELPAIAVAKTPEPAAQTNTSSITQIPGIRLEQTNRPPGDALRNVAVRNSELRDILSALAQDAGLNLAMGPDVTGRVTIDLRDATFKEALEAILPSQGLEYRIDGRLLRVFRPQLETRQYSFDYVNTTRQLSRSLSASAAAGFSGGGVGAAGGGSSGGSSTSISGSESTDLMKDLETELNQLKSTAAGARVILSKMSGKIFVTDYSKNLDAIGLFLETVQNSVNRQIVIEAKLIEVQLTDQTDAGVNWNVVLGNSFTFSSSLAPATAFQVGVTHKAFTALLSTLSTQGKVNVRAAPSISTLNNQPAVIRIGTQDVFFVTTTQVDPRTGTIVQTATTPATINEGVVLDVTPHISDDGIITMNIHPTLTDRTGQATSPQGDTVPIVDVRETDTIVRVADGDTIAIAGLISDRDLRNESKVPILGDIPLLGGLFRKTSDQKVRRDLAILLTPRILTLRTALEYTRSRMEAQDAFRQEQEQQKEK